MRTPSTWRCALLACSLVLPLLVLLPGPSVAQPYGIDPNRDCQVIRTCRFTPGGAYRGCLSSYSCRVCRLVAMRCSIDSTSRVCRQLRCTWG